MAFTSAKNFTPPPSATAFTGSIGENCKPQFSPIEPVKAVADGGGVKFLALVKAVVAMGVGAKNHNSPPIKPVKAVGSRGR